MKGIMDEPDLSLVNYSIMSDRLGNNQSLSMLVRSPSKPTFPEQSRSHAFHTSPKQIGIISEKLLTSPSPSRTNASVGLLADSFSHLTATSSEQSESLLSFEKYEDSLLTTSEYSLLQSQPKKKEKFKVLNSPVSMCFLAHLVYQPKSLIQSCFVHRHWCHLCTPPPGTGLDIETSYLVYICTYIPHMCTSNI